MEGVPVADIANKLGITSDAVKRRFQRLGIKPIRYVGSAGLYRESDVERILHVTRGRPVTAKKAKATAKKPKKG
jgi:predicted ArsR family transcriptional regulator